MKHEVEIESWKEEWNINAASLFFGHFLKILHSNFPMTWREAEENYHCFLHFTFVWESKQFIHFLQFSL